MVNQAGLVVGLGLLAGFIVIFIYVVVWFFKQRTSSDKRTKKSLCAALADPRIRSRTIIQQDIPIFHLPSIVPFTIQQPLYKKVRADTLSEDEYCNGYQIMSPAVQSVFVGSPASERKISLQLNDINTGHAARFPKQKLSSDSLQHSEGSRTPTRSPRPAQKKQRKVGIHKKKPGANLGKIEFSIYYEQAFRLLKIYVNRGYKITSVDNEETPPDVLVVASLSLKNMRLVWEQKTKTVQQSANPLFNQKLEDVHGIDVLDLQDLTLRFQVFDDYASSIIGEVSYSLKELPSNKLLTLTKPLELVQVYADAVDKFFYPQEPPNLGELLVALCHNPTDHKLVVKVQEARGLVPIRKSGKADHFVRVEVSVCGQKLFTRSTTVAHKTLNPVFNDIFVFDINPDKLPQVTLILKVKHRGIVRDTGVGVLHLGYCVKVESQYKHWEQVMEKPHLEIEQWHQLHDYEAAEDI